MTHAQSLRQRWDDGVRREHHDYREDRDPLHPDYVLREKVRGFQMLISTLVGTLGTSGFYVDRPRLLAAAIVPTKNLEVNLHSRLPNGRGQIIQEIEVIFVRNDQVCRMTGWVTTLNSQAKSLMQRLIERSIYPEVIIRPDACVALAGPRP